MPINPFSITDGGPTPTTQFPDQTTEKQIQEITSNPNLISQFHDHSIPISPFGLKTDTNADNLLRQIAKGTGGQYTHVQSPEELAEKVIELYKDWLGLSLSRPPIDTDGSYSVFINDFASHADIVAFRIKMYARLCSEHRRAYELTQAGSPNTV